MDLGRHFNVYLGIFAGNCLSDSILDNNGYDNNHALFLRLYIVSAYPALQLALRKVRQPYISDYTTLGIKTGQPIKKPLFLRQKRFFR